MPDADLTERAHAVLRDGHRRHLREPIGGKNLTLCEVDAIAAALQSEREAAAVEARRAAITAARSCARFECTMTDEIPRCPDCGATVEGNDPVRGVCQADAIRQVKAGVIEAYFRHALASPAPQDSRDE